MPPKPPVVAKNPPTNKENDYPSGEDYVLKELGKAKNKRVQPMIVSYEVKQIREPSQLTPMNKETARTSDLYKSDFLIKPLSKGQEMQPPSTSGFGAMNNSLGTALPGVSTSVFSLKKPSVQVNEFDKDANKEVDIDELN